MNKKTELFLHALRLLIRRSIYLLQTEYRAEHVAERGSEAVSGVIEIHVSGERIFCRSCFAYILCNTRPDEDQIGPDGVQ